MRIPRDVSAADLIKALKVLGYERTRQDGSHIRITTLRDGEHHATVPNHSPIRLGTLSSILKKVAEHHRMSLDSLLGIIDL